VRQLATNGAGVMGNRATALTFAALLSLTLFILVRGLYADGLIRHLN
jgi:hypothetical protein